MTVKQVENMIRKMKSGPEIRTPIGTDIYLPNHSGIASHPEALGKFVKKSGDTMTGSLSVTAVTGGITINSAGAGLVAAGNVGGGTVSTDTAFYAQSFEGLTQDISFQDGLGAEHIFSFVGGILIAYTGP